MEYHPMMECGHSANATDADGNPSCVICWPEPGSSIVARSGPDLSNREATCYCTKPPVKSDPERLAFFEYRGPGSKAATEYCKCGMARSIHQDQTDIPKWNIINNRITRHDFVAKGPQQYDLYYCGCRGWD